MMGCFNPFELCVLVLFGGAAHAHAYYPNPGETYPERVEIAVGASFNISCRMNPEMFPGHSARDLYFIDASTQERVPQSEIVIVNATTIMLTRLHAAEQQNSFLCKCGANAIMGSKVFVGQRPLRVSDFACRSYDFEYMLCNFTQPWNPLLTQYNLTFHLKSSAYSYDPACSYDEKPLVVCNLTLDSAAPTYHPLEQHYHFTLRSANALGSDAQYFGIRQREVMVPAAPGRDFRLINLTADAMACAWRMPKWELYHSGGSGGLVWEVLLQPHDFPVQNLSGAVRVQRRAGNELHLQLSTLPYAWWWYELRVRVRVRSSNRGVGGNGGNGSGDDEHMWSAPFIYRFRTAALRPARAPRSTPGAFYVDSMETHVRVYWEQLAAWEFNGDNFTYAVSEVRRDGRPIQLAPLQLEANSAVFAWQRDSHYEFKIRSRNHLGDSDEARVIEISALTHRNYPTKTHSPRAIHNVYHGTNHSYTLTWQAPLQSDRLRDYTVYWCNSKRAMQNECKGSIHFRTLSRSTHKFNTEPQTPDREHSLNLAVSANYNDGYNTGMHWTACNPDVNSDLIRMEPDVYVTNASAILVQWSPESVCPSILEGYNLTICEVSDSIDVANLTADNRSAATCLATGAPLRYTIDRNQKKHALGNLKPFTRYRVEMFMFSRLKVGKPSDALLVRTAEAAPTPPRQLQVAHVTNTSAVISWMPPSRPNGRLQPYVVTINNHQIEVGADAADPAAKIVYRLENLSAYMSYKVYVVARTVNVSEPSNDIHFMTLIGYPAMPGNINSVRINDTEQMHWKKPDPAAGRIEFYEVAVTQKLREGGEVVKRRISTLLGATTTTCALRTPVCLDPDHETTIEVRAVNAALRTHEIATAAADDDEQLEYFAPPVPWHSLDDIDTSSASAYEGNDELLCLGEHSSAATHSADVVQRYRNASLYRLYKSPWLTAKTIGCHANRISEITILALAVVVMSLAVMAALYVARKQYNKMANINCTLPAGLDTSYITKDSGGGRFPGDFVTPTDEEELPHLQRTKDFIRHNEKYHLLAAVAGNDSGYLGDGGVGGRCTPLSTRMAPEAAKQLSAAGSGTVGYMRTHSESSADSLAGSTNSAETIEAGAADETLASETAYCNSLPLQRIAEDDYVAPSTAFQSGYINPTQMLNWQLQAQESQQQQQQQLQPQKQPQQETKLPTTPTASASSGYVSVDSLQATPKSMPTPFANNSNNAANANNVRNMHNVNNVNNANNANSVNNAHNAATNLAAAAGYVLPSEIHKIILAPAAPPSSLSPQLAALPQATNLSGYTTLAELSKASAGIEMPEVTLSPPAPPASHGDITIGGYVTPRELSVFGQQQQPQFN